MEKFTGFWETDLSNDLLIGGGTDFNMVVRWAGVLPPGVSPGGNLAEFSALQNGQQASHP